MHRAFAFLAALVFTTSLLSAQTASPPAGLPGAQGPARDNPAAVTGTARIRGRVYAADTGQPLRKVQVRAVAPELRESRQTSTDVDGKYEFKELPAGRYTISASKGSFVGLSFGQLRPFEQGKPLQILDGQTVEKVDFTLPRGAVITGRILDEFGEPIADVSVATLRYQYIQGRRQLVPTGRMAQTNDIGEFRIFGLPPGQFYLSATLRNFQVTMQADDRSGYAPTYYPGTANVAEAQKIIVALGQTVPDISMALMPVPTARISGTVVDSNGKPASAGMVMVMQRTGSMVTGMSAGGQIRADGSFTVNGVAPGDYTLSAQVGMPMMGSTPESAVATITVAGEDVNGVRLAASSLIAVTGRVIVDAQTANP
jgi:hypothetical protein